MYFNELKNQQNKPTTSPTKRDAKVNQSLPKVGEYLNCTFKPTIMGSKYNKNILKKRSVLAKGADDAAKRMR